MEFNTRPIVAPREENVLSHELEQTLPVVGASLAAAFDRSDVRARGDEAGGRGEAREKKLRTLFDTAFSLLQKGKTGSAQAGDVQWLMRFLSASRTTSELRDFLKNNLSGTSAPYLSTDDKAYLNEFVGEWIQIRRAELDAYFEKKSAEEAM